MLSSNQVRWSGLAAILGGVLWIIKGGVILFGGEQPVYIIASHLALGQFLFAIGLMGLYSLLRGRGGWPGRIGGVLAYAALALTGFNAVYLVFAKEVEMLFPVTLTVPLAALSFLASLVFLGIAVWQHKPFLRPWNVLPLGMVASLPLMFILISLLSVLLVAGMGGSAGSEAQEELSERLIEVPLVLFGAAWVLLGYALWSRQPNESSRTEPSVARVDAK